MAHQNKNSGPSRADAGRTNAQRSTGRVARVVLLGVAAGAFGLAASARASAPAPSTSVAAAAPATTSTTAATGAPSQSFCGAARTSADLIRRISMSLSAPVQLKSLFEQADIALAQAATSTPTTAQGPVGSLRAGLSALHAAFDSAGYDLTKLPPDLVIKLGSRDVLDAMHSIDAYLAKAC